MSTMYVVKRCGKKESVHFDKITSRISKLCYGLDSKVCTIRYETECDHCNALHCIGMMYRSQTHSLILSLVHSHSPLWLDSMLTPLSFRKRWFRESTRVSPRRNSMSKSHLLQVVAFKSVSSLFSHSILSTHSNIQTRSTNGSFLCDTAPGLFHFGRSHFCFQLAQDDYQ